jgi:hypothetical protein
MVASRAPSGSIPSGRTWRWAIVWRQRRAAAQELPEGRTRLVVSGYAFGRAAPEGDCGPALLGAHHWVMQTRQFENRPLGCIRFTDTNHCLSVPPTKESRTLPWNQRHCVQCCPDSRAPACWRSAGGFRFPGSKPEVTYQMTVSCLRK